MVSKNGQAESVSTSVLKITQQKLKGTDTIFAMPIVTATKIFLKANISARSVRFGAERRIIEARHSAVVRLG